MESLEGLGQSLVGCVNIEIAAEAPTTVQRRMFKGTSFGSPARPTMYAGPVVHSDSMAYLAVCLPTQSIAYLRFPLVSFRISVTAPSGEARSIMCSATSPSAKVRPTDNMKY